jgi:HEAT repeat protein
VSQGILATVLIALLVVFAIAGAVYLQKQKAEAEPTSLLAKLDSPSIEDRREAARQLAINQDTIAEDRFIALLSDPDVRLRHWCIWGLEQMHSRKATPALLKLLDDPDITVREKAVTALGQLADKAVVPRLMALIERDADPNDVKEQVFRVEVCKALSRLLNQKFLIWEEARDWWKANKDTYLNPGPAKETLPDEKPKPATP